MSTNVNADEQGYPGMHTLYCRSMKAALEHFGAVWGMFLLLIPTQMRKCEESTSVEEDTFSKQMQVRCCVWCSSSRLVSAVLLRCLFALCGLVVLAVRVSQGCAYPFCSFKTTVLPLDSSFEPICLRGAGFRWPSLIVLSFQASVMTASWF